MKTRIINILKYMLFLGLGIFLIWWSLQQIPDDKWDEFKEAFKSARYWLLIPVFIILTFSHLIRAYRWKMLMEPLGYKPETKNVFFAVMVGYFANLAIPRLGEILKCTILAKYEKVPADKLVGTIVCERAFDILSLLIIITLAFALQFNLIGEYGMQLMDQFLKGKEGSFSFTRFAVFLIVIVLFVFIIRFFLIKYSDSRLITLTKKLITGIWEGIISVKQLKNKWQFLFSSAGIWFLYVIGTWLGLYATIGTSGLGIDAAVSCLAFSSIGMVITPGGIGTSALFMANVLEKNGIPYELGLANGTLQWFAQFLIIVIMGFISISLLPYFNKKKKDNEPTLEHTS